MACLAMTGLNADPAAIHRFADRYERQLSAAATAPDYLSRLARLLEEIGDHGVDTVLHRHLPGLISGWVREAFHPLIRIGYGIEFAIPEEIAAGLAYLQFSGADEHMEHLAHSSAERSVSAEMLFGHGGQLAVNFAGTHTFTERVHRVLTDPAFSALATVIPGNLYQMSRAALAAFATSHDFFALHLVTGSHAFRLLKPYAGPLVEPLLSLGLLAGYVAAGAPAIEPLSSGTADTVGWVNLIRDDEHDWKLAWSARQQARAFDDPAWLAAADRYLRRRR